jgi:hypothetical protein
MRAMVPAALSARLAELLSYAHRGSLDLPAGLIGRGCVFRLNGLAYDESLGRPPDDPLARLVGRGPAAYRFVLQALRYALPDLAVHLDDLQGPDQDGLVTAVATLTGTPRGRHRRMEAAVDVALVVDDHGRVIEVGVQVPESVLRLIGSAREA